MGDGEIRSGWVYVAAGLALLACMWIGWRDFDPHLSQEVVRASLHAAPRALVQLVVQYIAPVALAAFLVSGLVAGLRRRRGRRR